jgi:proline iminopeptidase
MPEGDAGAVLRTLYDPIEPYDTGTLEVEGGHCLYFERCGTPGAKPALFLHGGPGGGISPNQRRLFDPARYDILLFDQRGCGRSTPHASLENNTTWHLVADIERLRQHLGIERWLLFGGSWGSTLALAYAQTHPDRVSELVLRGIFTASRKELDWYYQHGASELFPDHWRAFQKPVPPEQRDDMRAAYRRLLTGDDVEARLEAARAWAIWEGQTLTLLPNPEVQAGFADPHFALAFARIENHYFIHGAWLEEGQLIQNAGQLHGIPGTIVQGRYDVVCPPSTAYALHEAWPQADFHLVEGAGHAWHEPATLDRLIRATDGYADRTGLAD